METHFLKKNKSEYFVEKLEIFEELKVTHNCLLGGYFYLNATKRLVQFFKGFCTTYPKEKSLHQSYLTF